MARSFIDERMGLQNPRNGAPKIMLGFIVRRCAADLGHTPTPDEFAAWANARRQDGQEYCLFGKPISPSIAKVMFQQPGRLVTVNSDTFVTHWRGPRD